MAFATEQTAVDDLANELLAFALEHLEVDEAIVHRDAVAGRDNVGKLCVIDLDRRGFDLVGIAHRQRYDLAGFEVHRLVDDSRAYLRSLGVQQNRQRVFNLAIERFDPVDDFRGAFVVRMRHVEAH